MLSPGLAQSPGVELHARTHSLPAPSPAPCSRLPRRPRSLRAHTHTHTSHSHSARRTLARARSHLRRGWGRGPCDWVEGTAARLALSLASQTSPAALTAPSPCNSRGCGARKPGTERKCWHRKPGDGVKPSGPTNWRRRARRRQRDRSPPSLEPRLAGSHAAGAGRTAAAGALTPEPGFPPQPYPFLETELGQGDRGRERIQRELSKPNEGSCGSW